jgi:hypothetical protein
VAYRYGSRAAKARPTGLLTPGCHGFVKETSVDDHDGRESGAGFLPQPFATVVITGELSMRPLDELVTRNLHRLGH